MLLTHRINFALLAMATTALATPVPQSSTRAGSSIASPAIEVFIPNGGQWNSRVAFVFQSRDTTAWLRRDGLTLHPRGTTAAGHGLVGLTFEGCNPDTVLSGESPTSGRYNFFLGSDPGRWQSGLRGYSSVAYRELYPGIELRLRGTAKGLEYDLLLQPGIDAGPIVIGLDGGTGLRIDPDGALVMDTPVGTLSQSPPQCWCTSPEGIRHPVAGRFRLIDADHFGFELDAAHVDGVVVIDPGLEWSTYFGGTGDEVARAVAFDPSGDVLIAGHTESSDLPVSPGAMDDTCNRGMNPPCDDVFIARFDRSSGDLVYSTFLGGSVGEDAAALSIDDAGILTLCGWTNSPNFPVTHGSLFDLGSSRDLFIVRVTADGSSFIFSAAFGGNSVDDPQGMAVAGNGDVIVGGLTWSTDFPVTPGAFHPNKGQQGDGFLLRLDSSGAFLAFATYLGGDSADSVNAVALDPAGNVLITGGMTSGSMPITAGAFSATANGPYVGRFSPDGSSVLAATYIGGSLPEAVYAIASVPDGDVIIAGYTYSDDFPVTPGAFQTQSIGSLFTDGYVTRFDPGLTSLVYSTFLTGGSAVEIYSMHVDSGGTATLAGLTQGGIFPTTTGAYDTSFNGQQDIFVSRLSSDGSKLFYSTYLGGSETDEGWATPAEAALAVDPTGAAVIAATTESLDFPTTPGAFQTSFAGGGVDATLTVLDMLPTGVSRYGSSMPGCTGPLEIGVTAMPEVGKPFGLTCTNAPAASTQGVLFLGAAALNRPIPAKGAALWVNPSPLFLLLPAASNSLGATWLQGAIPSTPSLVGATIYAQFLWPNPCGPPGLLSGSNALSITIQV
jgi:hypothetical protein